MQERRARQILQSLIQGLDPFNGEELAAGTVLQHADVLRALLAGVAALEQDAARALRRAQLPRNIGRAWSADEHTELIDAFQAGQTAEEIAARQEIGVENRDEAAPGDSEAGFESPRLEAGAVRSMDVLDVDPLCHVAADGQLRNLAGLVCGIVQYLYFE